MFKLLERLVKYQIEKDARDPSPEVTVEAVWCMGVRDTVDDGSL